MRGVYNPWLGAFAVLIAVVVAYIALRVAAGVSRLPKRAAAWQTAVGGAIAMGIGIWVMHLVGMLAFSQSVAGFPRISTVLLLLLIAGIATAFALAIARRYDLTMESGAHQHRQALEAANAQLAHLVRHDVLTGLPNRQLLQELVKEAFGETLGKGRRFALMILDIDRFKSINDTLGHPAGDELLKSIAQRLTQLARKGDLVARLGSDEFVMVADGVGGPVEAESLATRIVEELKCPYQLCDTDVHPSACAAVCIYPEHGTDIDTLLMHADTAMYHAKKLGHGAVQVYAPGMSDWAQERLDLENGLRRALQNKEFELHFQPKVNVVTGHINSAEALIRWQHPVRGMIHPDQFIPLAEETGLIIPIGEWVLREACRRTQSWSLAGIAPLRVAVNLSAQQFRQKHLLATVEAALHDTGLDPSMLELELTESAVMHNAEESACILEQLSRLGVHISIDDFGTGYSSLSYLKRFPLDKLKIDRSFIRELATNAEDAAIVRAIISLAHSLKLKVIAEGVETAEQLEFLRQLGCDQYQGFHCSPAMPPDEFVAWMQTRQLQFSEVSEADMMKTYSRLSAAALRTGPLQKLKA